MTATFDDCLAVVLREEGGFVDDPHDPGGTTNLGVTKAVWDHWVGRPSSEADMRGLTPAKVAPLYRAQYWNALQCDSLPIPLAMCVFDFGVNAGVSRGARYLQQVLGVAVDGHIGPASIAAVQHMAISPGVAELVRRYSIARKAYYQSLPQFPRYGRGWMRRVDEVETAALRMLP
jgi:lysozyme family protein